MNKKALKTMASQTTITSSSSSENFAYAIRGAKDGLWEMDLESDHFHASHRWLEILGFTDQNFTPKKGFWMNLVHPEDRSLLEAGLEACILGKSKVFQLDFRIKTASSEYLWVSNRGIIIEGNSGKIKVLAGSMCDITDAKHVEQEFLRRAYYDPLTNLANRALFLDRLRHALNRVRRHEEKIFAVVFIDVDRFKLINDSLGHMAGDQLLVILSRRLEKSLRPEDTIAHFGGDEFVVLVEDVVTRESVDRVSDRLKKNLSQPCRIEGHQVVPSVSMGIAIGSNTYHIAEELLRDADTALHHAKNQGPDRVSIFGSEMHDNAMARLLLEGDLHRAVKEKELVVYFQPIIRMSDGHIDGFEALVRWHHPTQGVIPPLDFIPQAEETGLIIPIGQEVLRQACRELKKWNQAGYSNLRISVNVSAKQFQNNDFASQLKSVLDEFSMSSEVLELEITESVTMKDVNYSIHLLRELTASGNTISIDDFGTGYSSLAYLQKFPLHTLKIDRSFVKDVTESGDAAAIVEAIVAMAKSLRLSLVAEGVETTEHLQMLNKMGCDRMQGYLFSPPIPPDQVLPFLEKYQGKYMSSKQLSQSR